MPLLWTVGSAVHTMFNLLLWHLAACLCCRPGGFCESKACWTRIGRHLLTVFVILITAMAVLIVLMKVALDSLEVDAAAAAEEESGSGGINFLVDDAIQQFHIENRQEYQFLLGYVVELALSFFVYYPLVGSVLFSGVLGCGRLPLLGGRPAEVRAEERRKSRLQIRSGGDDTLVGASSGGEDDIIEVRHF